MGSTNSRFNTEIQRIYMVIENKNEKFYFNLNFEKRKKSIRAIKNILNEKILNNEDTKILYEIEDFCFDFRQLEDKQSIQSMVYLKNNNLMEKFLQLILILDENFNLIKSKNYEYRLFIYFNNILIFSCFISKFNLHSLLLSIFEFSEYLLINISEHLIDYGDVRKAKTECITDGKIQYYEALKLFEKEI